MPPHHHRHHRHGPHGRHGGGRGGPDDFGTMRTTLDIVFGDRIGFELARMVSHGPPEIRADFQVGVCALAGQCEVLGTLGGDPSAVCSELLTWDDEGLLTVEPDAAGRALGRVCSAGSVPRTLHGLAYGPDEVIALGIVVMATALFAWAIRDLIGKPKPQPSVAAE